MEVYDRIVITWESVEVTEYRAVVTLDKYSELTGIPLVELLGQVKPNSYDGPLDLADELANIEDDASVESESFTRESIHVRVKSENRSVNRR